MKRNKIEPLEQIFSVWKEITQYDLELWATGAEPLDKEKFAKLLKDTVDHFLLLLPKKEGKKLKEWKTVLQLSQYMTIYAHYITTSSDRELTIAFDASKLIVDAVYRKFFVGNFASDVLSSHEVEVTASRTTLNNAKAWSVVYDIHAGELSLLIETLKKARI